MIQFFYSDLNSAQTIYFDTVYNIVIVSYS